MNEKISLTLVVAPKNVVSSLPLMTSHKKARTHSSRQSFFPGAHLKPPINNLEGAMDVVSSLWHMTSQKGVLILAGKHSSRVHICAMEYQQLVTTYKNANLSQINAHHRTRLQWGSEYQTSLVFEWSKRGWMPNGLVFECYLNTRQPKHLNTGQMDAILFSYLLVCYRQLLFEIEQENTFVIQPWWLGGRASAS